MTLLARAVSLAEAGADVIVPDFQEQETLVAWLFEDDGSR